MRYGTVRNSVQINLSFKLVKEINGNLYSSILTDRV
jgi:hypothetical protein